MTRARELAVLLCAGLLTVPAVGAPTAPQEARMTAGIADVQTTPGPPTASVVGYLVSTTVEAPPNQRVARSNLISPTATLDVDRLAGVADDVPYRSAWTASVRPRWPAGSGFAVHNGGAHNLTAYGTADLGTRVNDGDRRAVAVGAIPSDPTFPPRNVTSGGELSWQDPGLVRLHPRTRYTTPTGSTETAEAVAVGFNAVLRVDGGGLVADEPVGAPTLDVTIPDFDPTIVTFTYPTDLPRIERSQRFDVEQTGNGTRVRIDVTVEPGSRWPRSGNETPSGTWKYRIRVVAVGHAADGSQGTSGAASVLDLGPRGPGTETRVVTEAGAPRTVDAGPRARVVATPDGSLASLRERSWPSPATPRSSAQGEVEGDRCTSGALTPPHADLLPEGEMGLSARPGGRLFGVCMHGRQVGEIGVPFVEVDGQVHEVDMVPETPAVFRRSFGDATNPGTHLTVQQTGRAGPVALEVRFVAIDWGGPVVYAWWTDVHALDGRDHRVTFPTLADPDPGPSERFLAFGEAPKTVEGPVASERFTQTIADRPHEVTSAAGPTALLHPLTPTPLHVVRRDGDHLSGHPLPAPIGHTTPPEPLAGEDVATLWTGTMAGTHDRWPHGEGRLSPAPFLWAGEGV